MTVTATIYVYRDGPNGEEIEHEVEVRGTVTPFVPAKISGPPENCYPAEGGEVEDIEVVSVDGAAPPVGWKLTAEEEDEKAVKALREEAENDDGGADDAYDRWKDRRLEHDD